MSTCRTSSYLFFDPNANPLAWRRMAGFALGLLSLWAFGRAAATLKGPPPEPPAPLASFPVRSDEPRVEFTDDAGTQLGRVMSALTSTADGELDFEGAQANVRVAGRFRIAISHWPDEPRVVRLQSRLSIRALVLTPEGGPLPDEAIAPVVERSELGVWTLTFAKPLPAGEYAVVTGSRSIGTVFYGFGAELPPSEPKPPVKAAAKPGSRGAISAR
jgi:hypothetical protein